MTSATDHPASPDPAGLRERKKRRTREAIVAAASELFAAHGFEQTTIADIAEAADISPRTFFGYFPSKEAVVFHDHDELLASFGARLRDRAPRESAFEALRAWVASLVEQLDVNAPEGLVRRRLAAETPALAAHQRTNRAAFEQRLAEAVAADLGVSADALAPRLASAAAIAALEAVDRFSPEERTDPATALAPLDEAITFLGAGLEALHRGPVAAQRPRRRGAPD